MITNIYFAYFANTYNLFNDFLHFKYKNVRIKNDPTSSFIRLNPLKAKLLKKKCSSTSILTLAKITNKTFQELFTRFRTTGKNTRKEEQVWLVKRKTAVSMTSLPVLQLCQHPLGYGSVPVHTQELSPTIQVTKLHLQATFFKNPIWE